MGWFPKVLAQWLLLILFSPVGRGQIVFFEGTIGTLIQSKRALIADVVVTQTAQSPWGEITTVQRGKYWRSGKGQIRQDDEFGFSRFVDLREPRLSAEIDHELRLITAVRNFNARRRQRLNPAREVPFFDEVPKKTGEGIWEGFKVTIRRGTIQSAAAEAWTADSLGLPLILRYSSGTTKFEQRYTNIRLEEPDPAVFELPPGYRMRTWLNNFPSQPAGCVVMTSSIVGEPGEERYARSFGDRDGC